MILRKAIVGGIAAVALAVTASDTIMSPERSCAKYSSGNIMGEQQSQKFVGGKCFYYYANSFKQELLIYEPQPEHPDIGTLTEVLLTRQTNRIEISRSAVNDLRKGPNPDDINYERLHEIQISRKEERYLIQLFYEYVRGINSK